MTLQFNDLFWSSHYSEYVLYFDGLSGVIGKGGKIRNLAIKCEFIKGLALSFANKNWAVKVTKFQTGIFFL